MRKITILMTVFFQVLAIAQINGYALKFNGSNNYAAIPNSTSLNIQNQITLECWVLHRTGNPYMWEDIVMKGNDSYGFQFQSGGNRDFVFHIRDYGGWRNLNSGVRPQAGVWYHLAGTYDGEVQKIYVNGIMKAQSSWKSGINSNTSPLYFAYMVAGDNYWLDGNLDEVRVWDKALDQNTIRDWMYRNVTADHPDYANLKGYWMLNEASGDSVFDSSGNNNHGTLHNSPEWITSDTHNVWLGSSSSDWHNPSNWSLGRIPVSTDIIGVYKWDTGSELSITGSPTVKDILISSGSNPVLNSDIYVTGNILVENYSDLNGNSIILGDKGFLSEREGFGLTGPSGGSVITTRHIFSGSNQNIAGLGLFITCADEMGMTTITRGHEEQNINTGGTKYSTQSVLRYYNVTPDNNSGLNAGVKYTFRDDELNGQTKTDLALFRFESGTNWIELGGIVDTGNNTIEFSPIDSFTKITSGNCAPPAAPEAAIAYSASPDLSWTAVSGATSYKIYSSPDPYADISTWTLETTVTELTWTDEGATETKKFYVVVAVN